METAFRRDEIANTYTQNEWNHMYETAGKEASDLVTLWNTLYTSSSDSAVKLYNEMYEAVCTGRELSDPVLQAQVEAWNNSQLAMA